MEKISEDQIHTDDALRQFFLQATIQGVIISPRKYVLLSRVIRVPHSPQNDCKCHYIANISPLPLLTFSIAIARVDCAPFFQTVGTSTIIVFTIKGFPTLSQSQCPLLGGYLPSGRYVPHSRCLSRSKILTSKWTYSEANAHFQTTHAIAIKSNFIASHDQI